MKTILQNLKDGATEVAEVPAPQSRSGHVLVRTTRSLISTGTERMLLEFAKANLIDKVRQQPDKVKMVLDKVRTDGLLPTIDAVRAKLDQPIPLGYCNVGRVIEAGPGVSGLSPADRVASNGPHAEVVSVPLNLTARVPDNVGDEAAAFTVLGAIALQGIRLIHPTLGETVAVSGLGLIGLLTVQLLKAHGCRVLGLDFDRERLRLAEQMGASTVDLSAGVDPVRIAESLTGGNGVDGVIITASTRSSEPVHQAALMSRKRGRIVLVGVTGLELSRTDFYEKELTFQVSCSYGPGRYDNAYEKKGLDYPIGYVRWTEQRNFEAVLQMMADGRLDVDPLVTHRFAIDEAVRAYEVIGGAEKSLGVLLTYPDAPETDATLRKTTVVLPPPAAGATARAVTSAQPASIALVGSGNYASTVLAPVFKAAGARLVTTVSSGGVSGLTLALKFGFAATSTSLEEVLADRAVDAVVIATRHNSHAAMARRALEAGKHVFVEKPLALALEDVATLQETFERLRHEGRGRHLMVGFNRRFSPHVVRMKALVDAQAQPKAMVMTVNAGGIPAEHWTQDPTTGGGRIVGEACHFIDLLRHLAGAPVSSWTMTTMAAQVPDTATIQLTFADGSIGTVHYLANGSKAFPKERLEVFVAGRILQIDNFRAMRAYGWPRFGLQRVLRQDKGQRGCAAAFLAAVAGGPAPIAPDEIFEVARVSIELAAAAQGVRPAPGAV